MSRLEPHTEFSVGVLDSHFAAAELVRSAVIIGRGDSHGVVEVMTRDEARRLRAARTLEERAPSVLSFCSHAFPVDPKFGDRCQCGEETWDATRGPQKSAVPSASDAVTDEEAERLTRQLERAFRDEPSDWPPDDLNPALIRQLLQGFLDRRSARKSAGLEP